MRKASLAIIFLTLILMSTFPSLVFINTIQASPALVSFSGWKATSAGTYNSPSKTTFHPGETVYVWVKVTNLASERIEFHGAFYRVDPNGVETQTGKGTQYLDPGKTQVLLLDPWTIPANPVYGYYGYWISYYIYRVSDGSLLEHEETPKYTIYKIEPLNPPPTTVLKVQVLDASGTPLPDANVFVDGNPCGYTDVNGYVIIENISPGTHTVRAYKANYGEASQTVYVKEGKVNEVKIYLGGSTPPPSPNQPPTAYIDSIYPNPANQGDTVYFKGHGYDPDGSVVAYEWSSSIDGFLSSSSSFTTSSLSVGTHIIYFRVKDDKEAWSTAATATLIIQGISPPPPPPTTLSVDIWTNKGGRGQNVHGGTYETGEQITLYFEASANSYVSVYVEYPDGHTQSIVNMWVKGGETHTIDGRLGDTPGYRIYHIRAEDNYGNIAYDQCYITVKGPKMPDLVITDITWSPSEPEEGDTMTFTVYIKNQGEASSGSCTVKCYVDGGEIGSDRIGSLSPGQSTTVSFTWTTPKGSAGSHTVKAIVDVANEVSESNENNNERSETLTVKEVTFDFSISASPASQEILQGESTTFKIEVRLVSGSSQEVSLSISGLPSGTSYLFSPSSGYPDFTSTLIIMTSDETPAGTYTITITGSGGGKIHSTITILNVQKGGVYIDIWLDTSLTREGYTIQYIEARSRDNRWYYLASAAYNSEVSSDWHRIPSPDICTPGSSSAGAPKDGMAQPICIKIGVSPVGEPFSLESKYGEFYIDLSALPENQLEITIGLKDEKLIITNVEPSVEFFLPQNLRAIIEKKEPDFWNWILFWRPRKFHYYVTLTNDGDKTIAITGMFTTFPEDSEVRLTCVTVNRSPKYYGGELKKAYREIAREAFGGGISELACDLARVYATYIVRPEITFQHLLYLIVNKLIKEFSKEGWYSGDMYPVIPIIIYKDLRAFAILAPGESVTFKFTIEENARGAGKGVQPSFAFTYIEVNRVVEVKGWPELEHWVNFMIAYDWGKIEENNIGLVVLISEVPKIS